MGVKTMKFPKLVAAMLMAGGAFLYAAPESQALEMFGAPGIGGLHDDVTNVVTVAAAAVAGSAAAAAVMVVAGTTAAAVMLVAGTAAVTRIAEAVTGITAAVTGIAVTV